MAHLKPQCAGSLHGMHYTEEAGHWLCLKYRDYVFNKGSQQVGLRANNTGQSCGMGTDGCKVGTVEDGTNHAHSLVCVIHTACCGAALKRPTVSQIGEEEKKSIKAT